MFEIQFLFLTCILLVLLSIVWVLLSGSHVKILKQVVQSIWYFCRLVFLDSLHVKKNHLWKKYKLYNGKIYSVFRETVSDKEYGKKECTLVIGFELRFIRNCTFCHMLFQKISLLDTPIWVGFKGFKKKYWMVEKKTNNYLGLYQYQGKEYAQEYAKYITAILKPLSINKSVWYYIIDSTFEKYEKAHMLSK